MILILLGTQDAPFERILKAVSTQIKKGSIKEKVIAQTGCTKFEDEKIKTFDFVSKEELQSLMDKASVIITHGGVGIITECINKGKKVIVVPRLKKYKEHTNDHQLQITKEFADKGYVLPLYDTSRLSKALRDIKGFKPVKYESNNEHFKESIKNYIDNF
ncbi:MAG: PssE/Cps14G family polysaccharide biosynthesis glycosyltransferase [Bacilli bacterium]|nr:PssE/Cps14G family polysaccharide biosynthesis glycosyltransferase [Bacilli bacterium]